MRVVWVLAYTRVTKVKLCFRLWKLFFIYYLVIFFYWGNCIQLPVFLCAALSKKFQGKIKECIKLKKLGIKSNNIYCCICKNLKPEQNVEKYCTVLTYCNTVVKEEPDSRSQSFLVEPEPAFFSGAGASLF